MTFKITSRLTLDIFTPHYNMGWREYRARIAKVLDDVRGDKYPGEIDGHNLLGSVSERFCQLHEERGWPDMFPEYGDGDGVKLDWKAARYGSRELLVWKFYDLHMPARHPWRMLVGDPDEEKFVYGLRLQLFCNSKNVGSKRMIITDIGNEVEDVLGSDGLVMLLNINGDTQFLNDYCCSIG